MWQLILLVKIRVQKLLEPLDLKKRVRYIFIALRPDQLYIKISI